MLLGSAVAGVVFLLLALALQRRLGPTAWTLATVEGSAVTIDLDAGSLGFTVCGVPVVVAETSDHPSVELLLADGSTIIFEDARIGAVESAAIFGRTGEVRRIRAAVRTG